MVMANQLPLLLTAATEFVLAAAAVLSLYESFIRPKINANK